MARREAARFGAGSEGRAEPEAAGRSLGRGQLLFAGLVLCALWAFTFTSLAPLFEAGPWQWRAIAISSATILVGCLLRVIRPSLRSAAALGGVLACLLVWGWLLSASERAELWWRDPRPMIDDAVLLALEHAAPMGPAGPFEDLLLLAVLALAILSMTLLVGLDLPLVAGTAVALLLLVPPAIIGFSVDGWSLLGTGALLALLAWVGSPRPSAFGLVAAAAAVAVAAAAIAVAPSTRDRIWNEQILLGPVGVTVPDVTIALAEDLRERNQARAFSFESQGGVGHRFTLATLADFDGGRWLPQNELDIDSLTVDASRSDTSLPPSAVSADELLRQNDELLRQRANRMPSEVTITIEGLRSPWLPLPQGSSKVASADDQSGFDPAAWFWASESNTARAPQGMTRSDHRYTVEVRATLSMTEASTSARLDGTQRGERFSAWLQRLSLYPDGTDAPAQLLPYLELPDGMPAELADAAREASRGAETRLSLGVELQRWFRDGGFAYDESAPYRPGIDPDDPYAVMTTLLADRRGFCVHYASTFAVMARYLGAPTRIAIGYAVQASSTGDGVVRGGDLHAWPEIFVDGMGWVAFEPTPGGAGMRADAREAASTTPEAEQLAAESQAPETEAPELLQDAELGLEDAFGDQSFDAGASNGLASPLAAALWALALLAALGAPALARLARSWLRRARIARADRPAHHAWREFADTAVDLGYLSGGSDAPNPRARTPEALVEHLEALGALRSPSALGGAPGEQPESAARRLAEAVNIERYGASTAAAEPSDAARDALGIVLRALRAHASRADRMRARLLPGSLFRR